MFSNENKKAFIGNGILGIFILFVFSTLYFTNLFQTPTNNSINITPNSKLFKTAETDQFEKIVFKNKNGEFSFERNNSNEVSPWQMITPRSITANSSFFEKLISFLTTSNIKKIYNNDKINNSNFSFEKPTAVMSIFSKDNSEIKIEFGLLNTIDNSIYLKTSNRNGIFHLEAPLVSVENVSLLDLIESQIFNLDLNTISKLKIYHGKKNTEPTLEISKKDNSWFANNGAKIDQNKLEDYIQDLSFLKSSYIIDKQTDNQKRQINILKKNAEYILVIEDSKKNNLEYSISSLTREMPEMDLKNEVHFMITTSATNTAYLIKKEFYDLFEMKVEKLKELPKK